jgi:hypothetical protein
VAAAAACCCGGKKEVIRAKNLVSRAEVRVARGKDKIKISLFMSELQRSIL